MDEGRRTSREAAIRVRILRHFDNLPTTSKHKTALEASQASGTVCFIDNVSLFVKEGTHNEKRRIAK